MKEENLFENAVEAGETNSFFKGEGRYFVRDPDWGEHVYTAHYGSWVDRYTNSSSENASKFCESFSGFISGLDVSEQDMDHFFGNLVAIAYWKNEGALKNVSIFDPSSLANKNIKNYLRRLVRSKLYMDEKELIMRYAFNISEHGFELPIKL